MCFFAGVIRSGMLLGIPMSRRGERPTRGHVLIGRNSIDSSRRPGCSSLGRVPSWFNCPRYCCWTAEDCLQTFLGYGRDAGYDVAELLQGWFSCCKSINYSCFSKLRLLQLVANGKGGRTVVLLGVGQVRGVAGVALAGKAVSAIIGLRRNRADFSSCFPEVWQFVHRRQVPFFDGSVLEYLFLQCSRLKFSLKSE